MIQYVPSLPPPATAPATEPEMKALARTRRVAVRISPPLIVQPHVEHEPPAEIAEEGERRRNQHPQGERRIYCRRFGHLSMLVELRTGMERRRHNQRAGDITEHIDVET